MFAIFEKSKQFKQTGFLGLFDMRYKSDIPGFSLMFDV